MVIPRASSIETKPAVLPNGPPLIRSLAAIQAPDHCASDNCCAASKFSTPRICSCLARWTREALGKAVDQALRSAVIASRLAGLQSSKKPGQSFASNRFCASSNSALGLCGPASASAGSVQSVKHSRVCNFRMANFISVRRSGHRSIRPGAASGSCCDRRSRSSECESAAGG